MSSTSKSPPLRLRSGQALVAQNATRMRHPRALGLGLADGTEAAGKSIDPSAREKRGPQDDKETGDRRVECTPILRQY